MSGNIVKFDKMVVMNFRINKTMEETFRIKNME